MTYQITGPGGNSAAAAATAIPEPSPGRAQAEADRIRAEQYTQARSLPEQPNDTWEDASRVSEVETRISVDDTTHQMVVQLVDARTQETIREIPPEKIREIAHYLSQFVGQRVDSRA